MGSQTKQNGANAIRTIEKAAKVLGMSMSKFFRIAIDEENRRRKEAGNSSLICDDRPKAIRRMAWEHAEAFKKRKTVGPGDKEFLIPDYVIRHANNVLEEKRPTRVHSSGDGKSVRNSHQCFSHV